MFGLVSTQFLEGFSGIFRNCCSPCTGMEKRERERERERENAGKSYDRSVQRFLIDICGTQ